MNPVIVPYAAAYVWPAFSWKMAANLVSSFIRSFFMRRFPVMTEWCLYCERPLSDMLPEEIADCPNLPFDCCCDSCSWFIKMSDQEDTGDD